MTRWKASSIHLLISSIIILATLGGLCLLWYPLGLWPLAVPESPMLWLLGCVSVIGPLLTLIVYRAGKRTLRSDLIVVALIQALFFGYATVMLARARPVFLVAAEDHFSLVRAHEIDPEDQKAAAHEDYKRLSLTGPRLVGLKPHSPDNVYEKLLGGDKSTQPAHYVDFDKVAPLLLGQAKSREGNGARWVPLYSRKGSAAMVIDAKTGRPLQAFQWD